MVSVKLMIVARQQGPHVLSLPILLSANIINVWEWMFVSLSRNIYGRDIYLTL